MAYPACCVVRASIALPPGRSRFWATCGVTFKFLHSATKSAVSYALSPPTVTCFVPGICSSITSAASRSAVPLASNTSVFEGAGNNYLVEHSAGSGKSNTIGWVSHRLASLHDDKSQRVFDSVIVVTDRVVLDQQLQDTIYQFEHKRGVVQRIDESSRQLAEALESGVPIIITTLQKFPFVSRQLLKMAEQRGEVGTGTLTTRRCAVIIDEAHSSQSGETATELKGVLGGEALRQE